MERTVNANIRANNAPPVLDAPPANPPPVAAFVAPRGGEQVVALTNDSPPDSAHFNLDEVPLATWLRNHLHDGYEKYTNGESKLVDDCNAPKSLAILADRIAKHFLHSQPKDTGSTAPLWLHDLKVVRSLLKFLGPGIVLYNSLLIPMIPKSLLLASMAKHLGLSTGNSPIQKLNSSALSVLEEI